MRRVIDQDEEQCCFNFCNDARAHPREIQGSGSPNRVANPRGTCANDFQLSFRRSPCFTSAQSFNNRCIHSSTLPPPLPLATPCSTLLIITSHLRLPQPDTEHIHNPHLRVLFSNACTILISSSRAHTAPNIVYRAAYPTPHRPWRGCFIRHRRDNWRGFRTTQKCTQSHV